MEELMNLMVKNESPSQISDQIKDMLFAKSAERIEAIRSNVASSIFDEIEGGEEEESSEVESE
jgi:hypothetical protein